MCDLCDRHGRFGYKGQKFVVLFTRDGEEHVFGWQNTPVAGLQSAALMMPGVTEARIVQADEKGYPIK